MLLVPFSIKARSPIEHAHLLQHSPRSPVEWMDRGDDFLQTERLRPQRSVAAAASVARPTPQ